MIRIIVNLFNRSTQLMTKYLGISKIRLGSSKCIEICATNPNPFNPNQGFPSFFSWTCDIYRVQSIRFFTNNPFHSILSPYHVLLRIGAKISKTSFNKLSFIGSLTHLILFRILSILAVLTKVVGICSLLIAYWMANLDK